MANFFIPFGIFKRERIFDILEDNQKTFSRVIDDKYNYYYTNIIEKKDKYNSIEIKNNTQHILKKIGMDSFSSKMNQIKQKLEKYKKKELFTFISEIHDILSNNHLIVENNKSLSKWYIGDLHGEQKDALKDRIYYLLNMTNNNNKILDEILLKTEIIENSKMILYNGLTKIISNTSLVTRYIQDM